MPKQLIFSADARTILRGVDKLADGEGDVGPRGRNVVLDKKFGAPLLPKMG